MVVGGLVVVVALLAKLLRDGALPAGFVELVERLVLLLLGEFAPLLGFGSLHAFEVGFRDDAQTFGAAEPLLAHVGSPGDRVTLLQRVVDDLHELVQGHVPYLVPVPVVGDLHGELRVEGVVGERGEFDVVAEVDRQRRGERRRGVLPAPVGELPGHRAEISVEDAVQPGLPGRREAAVAALPAGLDHRVGVGLDHGVDLVEIGLVVAVVQSRIDLLGDDAVRLDAVQHVVGLSADGEVQRAVQADVFHGLFEVDVAHDPHLRKVQFGTSGAEDFAFEEREGRVTPAGSAAALVLDRGDGQDFDVGETVAFRGGRVGRLCRGSECVAERKCGENRFFHQSFGFRCLLSCRSFRSPGTVSPFCGQTLLSRYGFSVLRPGPFVPGRVFRFAVRPFYLGTVFLFCSQTFLFRGRFSCFAAGPSPFVRGGYFFDPATIFRQSSRVSSSGFAPFGRR